jgi:hypothetical protein
LDRRQIDKARKILCRLRELGNLSVIKGRVALYLCNHAQPGDMISIISFGKDEQNSSDEVSVCMSNMLTLTMIELHVADCPYRRRSVAEVRREH